MATDERVFNFRKNPSIQHKIRILNPGNKTGESLGITIPNLLAEQFVGCWMRIYISGTQIILESGCKLSPKDINENKKFCYDGMREGKNKLGQMEFVK